VDCCAARTMTIINNSEQLGRTPPSLSSIPAKSLPSRRRQHPSRQRDPSKINRNARFAHPRLPHPRHSRRHHHPRPQQRRLDGQHPAHRSQNSCRLRGRTQQFHHLRLLQNMPQLAAISRRLIPRRPHQPGEPTRPNSRNRSWCPLSRHHLRPQLPARPRHTLPQPTGLKPHHQPLNFPANLAQPPIQQPRQSLAQHPPHRPAAHLAAQRTQHRRQAQIRGRGSGCVHPKLTDTLFGLTQEKSASIQKS